MHTVLITGGSEGIGLAFARLFAADGHKVIIAAKDMMKLSDAVHMLQKEYHAKVKAAAIDLSVSGSGSVLYEKFKDAGVDVLINCAGLGYTEVSWQIPAAADEALIGVNNTALMTLTKLFLKDMCEKRNGIILNVASTGAFQPGPYIASYYASKSFVLSYTRAVAQEAREYGVHVHCLCPGPVDTAFYTKSGVPRPRTAMSAEKCALYAYKRLNGRKTVLVPGFLNKAVRLLPVSWRMRWVASNKKKLIEKKKR